MSSDKRDGGGLELSSLEKFRGPITEDPTIFFVTLQSAATSMLFVVDVLAVQTYGFMAFYGLIVNPT